jgi:hypothetical protein
MRALTQIEEVEEEVCPRATHSEDEGDLGSLCRVFDVR